MRLPAFLLLAVIASSSVGCAKSSAPASQPHAAESKRLRVKFRSAFAVPRAEMNDRVAANDRAAMDAEHAIIERMRGAGYDVIDGGPWDVRMELAVRVIDDEHATASAVFFDEKNRVVDRMNVSTGPKRVATSFVDEMRDSKKLKAKTAAN